MALNNPAFSNPAFQDPRAVQTYPGGSQAGRLGGGTTSRATTDLAANAQLEGAFAAPPAGAIETGRMTVEDTVLKTVALFAVLLVTAAVGWFWTMLPVTATNPNPTIVPWIVGALGGFVLAMVNSFKRVISPALVIGYAALEGVFVGAMSKSFQLAFGQGVVTGAVLGTVAAFVGTLAAYKFFDIQVSTKFRKWVVAAMFGFVAVTMLDFVLHFFGADFGFNGLGTMGLLSSILGLGLGVLMLILDFDFVERGIAAGLPERESWRAAFGLTVTLVWIYIELLRILAIFTRR
jgi:uncharacterized YccA/Bax inhibitor family protein